MTTADTPDSTTSNLDVEFGDAPPDVGSTARTLSQEGSEAARAFTPDDMKKMLEQLTSMDALVRKLEEELKEVKNEKSASPLKTPRKKSPTGPNTPLDDRDDTDSNRIQVTKPRLGGVDQIGAWTGSGRNSGKIPCTMACYREYENIKERTVGLSRNETICREKLAEKFPDPLFCLPSEEDQKYTLLDALKIVCKFMEEAGMDGVFIIQFKNKDQELKSVNMFKELGKVSVPVVEVWIQDLLKIGVQGKYGKQALCKFDATNLIWSGDALLRCTSPSLTKTIEALIPEPDERTGPLILAHVIGCLQTSNSMLVRELCKELEGLKLTDIPGEDVQAYSIKLFDKIIQIKANCDASNVPSDLTDLCMKGFVGATEAKIHNQATETMIMVPSVKPEPEAAIQNMSLLYKALVDAGCYKPAQTTTRLNTQAAAFQGQLKAMQSQVDKLSQQSSVISNPGGRKQKKPIDYEKYPCKACGAKTHWSNDPTCSKFKEKEQGGGGGSNPPLTEKDKKVLALIKEKTEALGDISKIADDKLIELKLGDEVVAKFCKQCKRFRRIGHGMHSTSEHVKKKVSFAGMGVISPTRQTQIHPDAQVPMDEPPQLLSHPDDVDDEDDDKPLVEVKEPQAGIFMHGGTDYELDMVDTQGAGPLDYASLAWLQVKDVGGQDC